MEGKEKQVREQAEYYVSDVKGGEISRKKEWNIAEIIRLL